ncbi:MAG: VanZ family protein [Oxalobacteraceae bacterium]|nr:VanZ family protein [Oxalobacteraceae bacterium]
MAIAFAFFALMVAIGAIPGEATALSAMVPDKLLHFTAYASLSGLIYSGLTGRPLSRAVRTLLAIALLGGLDETIQSFMPYRSADWADWEFDMLAALTCVVVLTPLHTLSAVKARRLHGS